MELDFKEFKEAKALEVAAQARVLAERPERAGGGAATPPGAAEERRAQRPGPFSLLGKKLFLRSFYFSRWDRPVHTFKLFLMSWKVPNSVLGYLFIFSGSASFLHKPFLGHFPLYSEDPRIQGDFAEEQGQGPAITFSLYSHRPVATFDHRRREAPAAGLNPWKNFLGECTRPARPGPLAGTALLSRSDHLILQPLASGSPLSTPTSFQYKAGGLVLWLPGHPPSGTANASSTSARVGQGSMQAETRADTTPGVAEEGAAHSPSSPAVSGPGRTAGRCGTSGRPCRTWRGPWSSGCTSTATTRIPPRPRRFSWRSARRWRSCR